MGYHTDFRGEFKLNKPLTPEHAAYLRAFNETRRMKRDARKASKLSDPIREAVGLPIGEQGAYFVGGSGFMGQDNDPSVVDHNCPPDEQPGLWCQWVPNTDGTAIEWDQGEKFYYYIQWIEYIFQHFLKPWGYKLSGKVEWRGEEWDDTGVIKAPK